MTEPPRETAIQMASRHLQEARGRLAQQEAIVTRMEAGRSGARPVEQSRELLEIMRIIVDMAERHVARLERGRTKRPHPLPPN